MKRRLDQYSGKLTAEKIAEGMNVAQQNASRLAADARLLFDNGRYSSALALAILSIEEVGKGPILRAIAVASDQTDLKSGWRDYRSHTKKNVLWPLLDLFRSGARRASDFGKLFNDDAEHPQLLENIKQLCFYTDCLSNCHWSVPQQIIERDLTLAIFNTAEILTKPREIRTEEIELWIQYLKPHWKQGDAARATALFDWDKEVRRRGIAEDGLTIEEFFHQGIKEPSDKPPKSN
jgi:AbiV family abortive infection protein